MSYPSMRHPLASIPAVVLILAVLLGGACHTPPDGSFAFEVAGNRLVGLLDRPERPAEATIIIVHGAGETNDHCARFGGLQSF